VKNKKKNRTPAPNSWLINNIIVYLLLLVIIPSILYFRVVNFGFSGLDDGRIVTNINNVQGSPFNLKEAFTHDAFMGDKGDTFYRPVQTISLMLDAQIGGMEPWIYHLSNLIFHLVTVVALFFFLLKTGIKREISFILSLLFSIHPLFTNAVAWIPARGDILLCLLGLLSFITILEYYKTKKIIYLVIHGIVFLFAVFAKETAILLPVLILSYIYFVQRKTLIIKDLIPVSSIWIVSFVIFFSLRFNVIKLNPDTNVFGIIPLLKNLPAIPITFFKFFIPYSLCTMPFFDIPRLIGGIILLSLFIGLTFKIIPGEKRTIIWGVAWFLAFTVPPMFFRTYLAKVGYEYFEYRAYLPIIGILFIMGILVNDLIAKISFRKTIIISILLLLVYSSIAYYHSGDFADPILFFSSAINCSSHNSMALSERGIAFLNKGDNEAALSDFDSSIKIWPENPLPYFNKGVVYSLSNNHKQAEYFYSQSLKFDTLLNSRLLNSSPYVKLSKEKLILGEYNKTISLLEKGTKLYPENDELHNNFGLAYYNTMKFDSAFYEYSRAIESQKEKYSYYDNRGMANYHLNKFTEALKDFNRALELKPDFLDSWGNRAMVKIKLKDYNGAIIDLTKAINIKKNLGAAWYYRGIAYFRLNKQIEAETDWAEARKLGFKESTSEKQKEK
jgi:protein O-mannosyl-transferase